MTSHHLARALGPALAVALLLDGACGLTSLIEAEVRTFRSESSQEIGELRWEIQECKTGTTLSRATHSILARDVAIERVRDAAGGVVFYKRIDLENGFFIELVEYPEDSPGDLTGFALNADKRGVHTFSWDWFNVENGSRAVKIQESGELAFTQVAVGPRWEIGRTEITSAVSLRVFLFDVIGGAPDEPEWRVRLGKGSYLFWPSVVDDLVILNVPVVSSAQPIERTQPR